MQMWSKAARTVAAAALAAAAPAVALAADTDAERTLRRSFTPERGAPVRIDLRWGQLEIEPASGETVDLVLYVECRRRHDRCLERIADIDLAGEVRRGGLDIDVVGLSRWTNAGLDLRLVARVPRRHALRVDMGAGEVSVEGFGADLDVDLGAGEIRVRMAEDAVQRVDLAAGVGDATLRRADGGVESRRAHLVGSSVRWDEGPGDAQVDLRVGAGEVDVMLD